jgi:regulator of protease activity HflC (stomatin/prohibitin superfamily)
MQGTAVQSRSKKIRGFVIAGIILLIVLITAFSSFTTIASGTVGVVSVFGAVKDDPIYEGLHTVIPFVTTISKINTKTQKVEALCNAASKDLQTISTTIVVNYHVVDSTAPVLYRTVGYGYQDIIIVPAIQESVKAVTAQYSAEELITKRQLVSQGISDKLTEKIGSYGLVIEVFNITDLSFSESFNAAIEAKQTAQQEALKAEQDLNRIKIEAEQTVVNAQADADAMKARADAEAYSIEVIQDQLAQSEAYLEYQKIEKWDGQLPQVMGDGVNPIIDFRDITPSAEPVS